MTAQVDEIILVPMTREQVNQAVMTISWVENYWTGLDPKEQEVLELLERAQNLPPCDPAEDAFPANRFTEPTRQRVA